MQMPRSGLQNSRVPQRRLDIENVVSVLSTVHFNIFALDHMKYLTNFASVVH